MSEAPAPSESATPLPPSEDADAAKLQANAERAFLVRAAKEGLVAADDALRLIGPLVADDQSQAVDLDGVFTQLREQRPWLFARQQSPGLTQLDPQARDASDDLRERAQSSGLTRDIQLWREARRKR